LAGRSPIIRFSGKLVWVGGMMRCFAFRHPNQRRARRTPIAKTSIVPRRERGRDGVLLALSFTGLFTLPVIYVTTGEPRIADYPFRPALAWLGTPVVVLALFGFYRTHRDLGRCWSVTLEIRQTPPLITTR